MASTKSVPYRCPKCLAEGSYYGRLVFGDEEAGNCIYHKGTAMERVEKKEGDK